MTIYSSNINSATKHILVYNGTTPICVIELPLVYGQYNSHSEWENIVKRKLEEISSKKNIDLKELSSKPIEIYK